MTQAPRILISACLLGERVRYNGQPVPCEHPALACWLAEGRVLACCPEVTAGLPVPRPPSEIETGGDGNAVLAGRAQVVERDGGNVTAAFIRGAQAAVEAARAAGIRVAILKEGSPSCGSSAIANGQFAGVRISGEGVTAAALRAAGVRVYSEAQIDDAAADLLVLERGPSA